MEIRSPFPGMDPWLELFWEDVHQRALTYAADALQEQLPGGLRARLQERVYVDNEVDQIESAIGIVDLYTKASLTTAIELLSPSNKGRGVGREAYRQKQQEVVANEANLVEIDLLSEGERVSLCPAVKIPEIHRTAYQVCILRSSTPARFEVYPVPLRERLPVIRIPLRKGDEDVTLDLQSLIEQTYARAAYDFLDYSSDPVPPLDPDDAAWADGILKNAGKR
jgi:hypothetical protein